MSYRDLIARWGIDIRRPLLRQALTHRSFAFEHDEPHNERLEFLGDSILNLITAEKVYREFPNLAEGVMTPIKWYAASEKGLADIARQLGLRTVAVPLRNRRGEVVASMNVSVHAARVSIPDLLDRCLPMLLQAQEQLKPLL